MPRACAGCVRGCASLAQRAQPEGRMRCVLLAAGHGTHAHQLCHAHVCSAMQRAAHGMHMLRHAQAADGHRPGPCGPDAQRQAGAGPGRGGARHAGQGASCLSCAASSSARPLSLRAHAHRAAPPAPPRAPCRWTWSSQGWAAYQGTKTRRTRCAAACWLRCARTPACAVAVKERTAPHVRLMMCHMPGGLLQHRAQNGYAILTSSRLLWMEAAALGPGSRSCSMPAQAVQACHIKKTFALPASKVTNGPGCAPTCVPCVRGVVPPCTAAAHVLCRALLWRRPQVRLHLDVRVATADNRPAAGACKLSVVRSRLVSAKAQMRATGARAHVAPWCAGAHPARAAALICICRGRRRWQPHRAVGLEVQGRPPRRPGCKAGGDAGGPASTALPQCTTPPTTPQPQRCTTPLVACTRGCPTATPAATPATPATAALREPHHAAANGGHGVWGCASLTHALCITFAFAANISLLGLRLCYGPLRAAAAALSAAACSTRARAASSCADHLLHPRVCTRRASPTTGPRARWPPPAAATWRLPWTTCLHLATCPRWTSHWSRRGAPRHRHTRPRHHSSLATTKRSSQPMHTTLRYCHWAWAARGLALCMGNSVRSTASQPPLPLPCSSSRHGCTGPTARPRWCRWGAQVWAPSCGGSRPRSSRRRSECTTASATAH